MANRRDERRSSEYIGYERDFDRERSPDSERRGGPFRETMRQERGSGASESRGQRNEGRYDDWSDEDDWRENKSFRDRRREWDPANYGDLDRERGPGNSAGRRSGEGGEERDEYRDMASARTLPYAQSRQPGPHRGKGPKGYTRSDDRIREDLSDRLADDDLIDASEITVSVAKGEVTLDGTVGSRQERRAAEDCAEGCSGVTHVQNNLRVRDGNAPSLQATPGRGRTKES